MRRRLAFLSTLVALLLVLVLPATALGSSYTYKVQKNTCSAAGGMHGYGHIYFKVKLTEYGLSGANKFTFTAKAQERYLGSSRWHTESNYGTYTYTFPNNSASYYYIRWYTYDPSDFNFHRIQVQMKVWNNGWLLAKRTVVGKYC